MTNQSERELIRLELMKYEVIRNFLLEAMEARNEPVDLRMILFGDDTFSDEELIAGVNNLAHQAVKQEPIYTKDELQQLIDFVSREISNFEQQLLNLGD